MKKRSLIWATLALLVGTTACNTMTSEMEPQSETKKTVRLNLSLGADETKVTGTTSQSEDNTISTLDVFVFDYPGPTIGEKHRLDAYKRFSGSTLSDVSLDCSTGDKLVCVIANSPYDSYSNLIHLSDFRELTAQLKNEGVKNFTMYGERATMLFQTTQNMTITLKRFVSKITLTDLKTNFTGTPLEGLALENVELYLLNVYGEKNLYSNENQDPAVLYNVGALDPEDVQQFKQTDLIAQTLPLAVDANGLADDYCFYCYENLIEGVDGATMLVIQADIDGQTYYYPIPINQADFGYNDDNKHFGVRRNTCYSVGVTITGLGSDQPTTPIYTGTFEVTVNTEDWKTIPHFDKVF